MTLINGHTSLHHDLSVDAIPFLCAKHITDFIDSKKRILKERRKNHHRRPGSRRARAGLAANQRRNEAPLI
ncbi:MAG: hypothetical protein FWC42_09515 [Proteobacteria bacterium]|nr:hypothetical protein [Pseudomonadota bacterium]MCL2310487.1 hypothetical protein [Pseudomonadota bacterium]